MLRQVEGRIKSVTTPIIANFELDGSQKFQSRTNLRIFIITAQPTPAFELGVLALFLVVRLLLRWDSGWGPVRNGLSLVGDRHFSDSLHRAPPGSVFKTVAYYYL